jgi:hypothetical protein
MGRGKPRWKERVMKYAAQKERSGRKWKGEEEL